MVLWDTPVGLLGAVYLLLLVAILVVPPGSPSTAQQPVVSALPDQPHRQRSTRSRGRQRGRTSGAAGQLQEPLLSPVVDAAEAGSTDSHTLPPRQPTGSWVQGSTATALRWLLPGCLALLCAADLAAQYALVVGAIVQDRPLLPPGVTAWIRDVVGIDDTAAGPALLLALLRPTLLLAALAVYR